MFMLTLPFPLLFLLFSQAASAYASLTAIGRDGVQVADGIDGQIWGVETIEMTNAEAGTWRVKSSAGRQATCYIETTGMQSVLFTFSSTASGDIAIDKCGCHDGSHVICSYDDDDSPLSCPNESTGPCLESAPQKSPMVPATQAAPVGPAAPQDSVSVGDWGGLDLLDAKSTATWRALDLDGLLAIPNSYVSQSIANQPDVIDAIRKVSAESGVPSGLLAAMVAQESSGNRETETFNPGYSAKPADQQKDVGLIQSPLWAFEGETTAQKMINGQDPYLNLKVFAEEAAAKYAQSQSWGLVAQFWYTGFVATRLGGVTGGASKETNYVLNVFDNLALGGSDYYPTGGYSQ